jgi:16S rRNA (cytosine1402-N4)-methyltransferase
VPPFSHVPVLADAVLDAARQIPRPDGLLIDATLGGGGHSALLLEQHPGLRLIGLDQDATARAAAAERLEPFGDRVSIVATNFADYVPPEPAVMVLADLGVSSPQLDVAARGFSFRLDGPLDMRMNSGGEGETAAELIDRLEENALADLIYAYGEERLSRRIARRIKADLKDKGSYEGTAALAYAVAGCYPPKARRGRIHPATRTFQALRIAVNDELGVLDRLLLQAPDWLEPEGLLGIISFHSLEDRRVKTSFLRDERLQRITRKPVVATEQEEEANPRSRSAKWRVASRTI